MAIQKLLVAVKSCQRDLNLGFHDAIRSTWGAQLKAKGVDVRFFIGHSGTNVIRGHVEANQSRQALILKSDESMVDAPDDYDGLPHKTRAIARWMQDRVYSHAFLCDNDTIINPKVLLDDAQPWNLFNYDYAGQFFKGATAEGHCEFGDRFYYKDARGEYPECYGWASGGMGYFLSKQAAERVADTFPKVWAEDMYVGQVLGPHTDTLLFGDIRLKGATEHFRKHVKTPVFTPELLRKWKW